MASEDDIIQRESRGDPYVGYTPPGKPRVSLRNAPLNQFGFPIWSGNMGPAGISHAAGLYQFQPGTWEPGARALGITDFSPASQKAVYDWTRVREGERPWAASAPGGKTSTFDPESGRQVPYLEINKPPEDPNLAGMLLLSRIMGGKAVGDEAQAGPDEGLMLLTSLMGPSGAPPEGTQASEATDTAQAPIVPVGASVAARALPDQPLDARPIRPVGPQPASEENLAAARRINEGITAAPVPGNVKQYMRRGPAMEEGETIGSPLRFDTGIPPEDQTDTAAGAPNVRRQFENIQYRPEAGRALFDRLLAGVNPIGSAQAAEREPPPAAAPAPPAQPEHQAGMNILKALMEGPIAAGSFFKGAGEGLALPGEALKERLPAMSGPEQAGAALGRIPGGMIVDPVREAGQLTERVAGGDLAGVPQAAGGAAMLGVGAAPKGALGSGLGRGPGFMPKTEPTSATGKAVGAVRKTINEIFSPTTVDPTSLEAESVIRQSTGTARRETEAANAAVEPHRALVNAHMPEFEAWMRAKKAGALPEGAPKPGLLRFLDFVEGRSGGAKYDGPPELRPLADELRKTYRQRRSAIEAEPTTEKTAFLEDYFSHMWQEKETMRAAYAAAGQGSGRSLKQRTIPTISEGIELGYTPVSLDPIATTMTYVANMDRFLAHNRVFRISKDAGMIQFHAGGAQPEGWVRLNGRLAEHGMQKAYAPEAFARVYNNAISSGVYESRLGGDIYNAILKTKNTLNSFVLGMSGYHAAAMGQEASASALARAVGAVTDAEAAQAAKQLGLGGMPFAKSVDDVLRTGRKLQRQYLRVDDYGADYEAVAKLLAEGGGRIVGRGQEWRGTAADNFFKSWKRGALKLEARAAGREIAGSPWRAPLVAARELARINDTIMAPIFDGMIPRLKSAAFFDEMSAWLKANPQAGRSEQLAKSRQLIDVVDDRFGEMILDNIFWAKGAKQFLQLATVSLGWELGTLRTGLGATSDVMRGRPLSPRVRYLIGLAGAVALYNSSYEYLMTGKGPQSPVDLVTSRTGGKTPEGAPERALLPGYEKDALGWWHHPTQEPFNKISPLFRLTGELATGKDYFGREIAPFAPGTPDWFKAYGKHVLDSMVPIPLKNEYLKGTAIPQWQRFMGIRPAPEYIQNPQRFDDMETRRRLNGLRGELRGLYAHGNRTTEDRASIEKKAAEIRRRIQKTTDEAAKRKLERGPRASVGGP